MAFVGGWVTYHRYNNPGPVTGNEIFSSSRDGSGEEEENVFDLSSEITETRRNAIVQSVEKVAPATVSISVTQVRVYNAQPYGFFNDPLWEFFYPEYRRQYRQLVQSMGSGFIVNPQGYIVTNYHVVENATEIKVNLPDGREFEADFIGSGQLADLAILKVDAQDLPFINIGDSDDLIIGEWAIALGNPFGYIIRDSQPTVTVGVISALNRNFESQDVKVYRDMIQTDAAINPGNSGGPLVNARGEVIGVNTFIVSASGGSIGLGFAIPINKVKRILQEVMVYGEVRRFWTGLSVQELNRLIATYLNLEQTEGVIVSAVEKGSPAEEAGIEVADIIIGIDDKPVMKEDDLIYELYDAQVGEVIKLKILRGDKEKTVELELKEKKQNN
ncbi:trypsin-like peptidase domain-containing protein [bacterium]|nr:trypsin-like peptidase domain-containing protein [bacterium]